MMTAAQTPGEVLVIEDDQGCSDLIAEVVEDIGYRVTVSDRASGALELIRERTPVLVVLDVMLPDGDGFSILDAIRQDAAVRNTPVLVCTAALLELLGFPQPENDPRTEILTKPFHIDTLIEVLQRLIAAAT